MFSMRDCSMCECALYSKRMVKALVVCFNAIIKFNHCPERRLKIVHAMIEKEKCTRTNKLRMLEMIDVDIQLIMRVLLG